MMRWTKALAGAGLVACLAGCDTTDLETRTYDLSYLQDQDVTSLIQPYIYAEREGAPGSFAVAGSAITVRETPENLERIEHMLAEFDVPKPLTMLHFQIIRADGAADPDPAIADVERELRRLFRFDGYELLAETRVGVMEGATIRQNARGGGEVFIITGAVRGVRARDDAATITLELTLWSEDGRGQHLETQVTIPTGHAVVVGTMETPESGALILVVRAELAGAGIGGGGAGPGAVSGDSGRAGL